MLRKPPQRTQAEIWLERINTPILVLAAVAVLFYLLELFHLIPPSYELAFLWLNFLIDLIFLVDIVAKVTILGRGYLKSPWFLIDFISTLPIISSAMELMGALGPQLQATRVARGARVARIARVARVARLAKVARVARLATAIRAQQGLSFLKSNPAAIPTPRFNKALFFAVPVLLMVFIIASAYVTKSEVSSLRSNISDQLLLIQTESDLTELLARYAPNVRTKSAELASLSSPMDSNEDLIFSLHPAFVRADRISGIMLLVVLATIGVIALVVGALAKDRSQDQERSILSQCFSPAIVNKFYESPETVERFFNQWMTVFFIDIRGFTKQAEMDNSDVEGLALKLRRVMDTARDQIVVSHEGVIDKFMGDAVMGWVGGHFSSHWHILGDIHDTLFLDQLELIDQDIKSIEREKAKSANNQQGFDQINQLEALWQKAKTDRELLLQQQRAKLDQDQGLEERLRDAKAEYRRRVAKSAVECCLKITETVSSINDPQAFTELKIGIGSGPVLVGNFGSTDQIGFTVLGPTVNRAARLEPASAQCGCKILIDEATYHLIANDPDLCFRRLPPISLKGLSSAMITYEPFFRSMDHSFLTPFEHGVSALESGDCEGAIAHFNRANSLRSDVDLASQIWTAECHKIINSNTVFQAKVMSK